MTALPLVLLTALLLLTAPGSAAQSTRPAADTVVPVRIDAASSTQPLELWRHTLGHGGINSLPLPDPVVEGTAKLRPRLTRRRAPIRNLPSPSGPHGLPRRTYSPNRIGLFVL